VFVYRTIVYGGPRRRRTTHRRGETHRELRFLRWT